MRYPNPNKTPSIKEIKFLGYLGFKGEIPKTSFEAGLEIADLLHSWRPRPPTQKQLDYLEKLGYEGSTPATCGEASNLIGKLKAMRGDKSTDTTSLEIYGDKWSEKNPFEKIHEHTPDFHAAKLWRDSFLDN